MDLCAHWFEQPWITDWNVCDWLCVRLLTPLLDDIPETALPVFHNWNSSPLLWQARASLVPFAQSTTIAKYEKTILAFSRVLIQREERFCKTGHYLSE